MKRRFYKNSMILLILLALFSVLGIHSMLEKSRQFQAQDLTLEDAGYRRDFFSESMRCNQNLSSECQAFLTNVEKEAIYFPIPESTVDKSLSVSYTDSWMQERNYGGESGHEGTDLMAARNERGIYPVLSVSDGTVTNLGWLEKGGYRVGITSESGTYYYYAHLESYANIRESDRVRAGELLGYMGDSGYGPEGTTGQFDVHLHFGIYLYQNGEEYSFNPYHLLCYLEKHKLKYAYS